jgi:YebC/PmpR family DNA-binding regulatory protein
MSGHSKWASIKHQKASADAKRGKIFTRIAAEITIAAKSSDDIDKNPALRLAVSKARAANMPNDNIKRAIDRGSGKNGNKVVEELIYEAYGPGGIGIIIEALSDNRNRTGSDVKAALNKFNAALAGVGAVLYQFEKKAVLKFKNGTLNQDELILLSIESGVDDIKEPDSIDDELLAYVSVDKQDMINDLLSSHIDSISVELIPKNKVIINDDKTLESISKLLSALENVDDVVAVSTNLG